ncbi:leucine-zipper of insertion element IS481 [Streptomyces sp. DpondAA-D4]|nr:leucine-zipper of insertion element IS481 [Streptomyces sp. DpondAA-D4]SCD67001.1 leucine-zipper of insertion element IS481 [Streptomyces sp. PpalLS-921]
MSHRNARLPVHGRRLLIQRIRSGRPVAHVAAEMGISRATAHKWVRRWKAEGDPGLFDRLSRPRTTPHRTAPETEAVVCDLRQTRKLGPARIGPILGLPASMVHRILTRHGLNRPAWLARPTGEPIRRHERSRPGELMHVDIKKIGNIPDGGGWRTVGRTAGNRNRQATTDLRKNCKPVIGYSYTTPPSTTTPASPTAKSCPTNASTPRSGSGNAPTPSSRDTESPSNTP